MTYVVHIGVGSLALICGYLALYVAKGGRLHRKSGMLFVYAMLADKTETPPRAALGRPGGR